MIILSKQQILFLLNQFCAKEQIEMMILSKQQVLFLLNILFHYEQLTIQHENDINKDIKTVRDLLNKHLCDESVQSECPGCNCHEHEKNPAEAALFTFVDGPDQECDEEPELKCDCNTCNCCDENECSCENNFKLDISKSVQQPNDSEGEIVKQHMIVSSARLHNLSKINVKNCGKYKELEFKHVKYDDIDRVDIFMDGQLLFENIQAIRCNSGVLDVKLESDEWTTFVLAKEGFPGNWQAVLTPGDVCNSISIWEECCDNKIEC